MQDSWSVSFSGPLVVGGFIASFGRVVVVDMEESGEPGATIHSLTSTSISEKSYYYCFLVCLFVCLPKIRRRRLKVSGLWHSLKHYLGLWIGGNHWRHARFILKYSFKCTLHNMANNRRLLSGCVGWTSLRCNSVDSDGISNHASHLTPLGSSSFQLTWW
jgi:hypothetical protein